MDKPTIVTGIKMSPTTPEAVLDRVTPVIGASGGGGGGGGQGDYSSNTATTPYHHQKRKRDSISGIMSSPGSVGAEDEPEDKRCRQPGVKRACNECRQQKVRRGRPAWEGAGRDLLLTRASFAATSSKSRLCRARAASALVWSARLSRISSVSASGLAKPRWPVR
jgi:hypothetical protein